MWLTDRIRDGAIETPWSFFAENEYSDWLTDRIRDGAIETLHSPCTTTSVVGLPIGFAMARLKRNDLREISERFGGLPIGFAMARLKSHNS